MPRKPATNKYQKAQHRRGERRLRGDEVNFYLSLAGSQDVEDRIIAMENLCPCHVRKRIDTVWEALYRGLQDADIRVRKAAWHTLEDGGRPNDPKLRPILIDIAETETDPKLRYQAIKIIESFQKMEMKKAELIGQKADYFPGKCDWCGATNVPVTYDYETEIDTKGTLTRFGQICESCNDA